MRALEKGEQYEMMFDLFKDLQKTGMPIDPEILSSVLRAQDHVRRHGLPSQTRQLHPMMQPQMSLDRYPSFYNADGVRNHQTQQLIQQFQDMNFTPNRRDGRGGF